MKLCSCHVAILRSRACHILHIGSLNMGKSGKSYYAVRVGKSPGQIFRTWPECEAQVKGFNGAQYKGFKSEYEALSYLGQSQAAGQHMGINAQSRGIAKHTSCATDSRGAAAALRAQQAFASRADMTEAADLGSRQTDSAACQSGRPCAEPQQLYRLEFDGGARGNPGPSGAGAALYNDSTGEEFATISEPLGDQTNNFAEYTGLLRGLQAALACGVRHIRIKGDSKLVVMQVNGAWQVHNAGLKPLYAQVMALQKRFQSFTIDHIFREANERADELSNVAMDGHGWSGLRDSQGNTWSLDESQADSQQGTADVGPEQEQRTLSLPTMIVRRQGNGLAAQSRSWMR